MAGQVQIAKPITQSKTIIFNVLSLIVVILSMTTPMIAQLVKDPATATNVKDLLGAVIALVNILLRFGTTQPLKVG